MVLRALALVAVLGVHPAAGALEGLFHLCHGKPRLHLTCCCDDGPQREEEVPGAATVRRTCCASPAVHLTDAAPATASLDKRWEMVRLDALPASWVPALPPVLATPLRTWERDETVRRATAPPLYIQLCSYLI